MAYIIGAPISAVQYPLGFGTYPRFAREFSIRFADKHTARAMPPLKYLSQLAVEASSSQGEPPNGSPYEDALPPGPVFDIARSVTVPAEDPWGPAC
jgi:hypothetical protein